MDAQLERLDDDRVRLTIEVPAGEVHHAVEHATHDLAGRVKVPGFRAGKVPEQVLVSRIGRERLYAEAVESHIGSWFRSAARTNRLLPTEQPRFDYELPTTPDESWTFQAEFPVQGPAEPADWTKLEVAKLDLEVPDEAVENQLSVLQSIVAPLSPVEGRPAQPGDVAVIDMLSDEGPSQHDYVVELGSGRLVEELEEAIQGLSTGESKEVAWELADGSTRGATIVLEELHEKVLPPQDDELARAASEFDSLADLRANIEGRIRDLLDQETENRFRVAAVDELLKASQVVPARLAVQWRTEELITTLLRQLDERGIDAGSYLRMMGMSGADLEQRLAAEAAYSIGRELVLEGVADKLGIEISDDDVRAALREEGEVDEDIDEFMEAGGADRIRPDLRLREAAARIAAEVTPISPELAETRESIWTPGKEQASSPENKLWIPGTSTKE